MTLVVLLIMLVDKERKFDDEAVVHVLVRDACMHGS